MLKQEITANEFENTLNEIDSIEELNNKNTFFAELNSKLEKSEEDLKNGRVHSARTVFKELREKYGY